MHANCGGVSCANGRTASRARLEEKLVPLLRKRVITAAAISHEQRFPVLLPPCPRHCGRIAGESPIPQQVPRIDLALVCGIPTLLDTVWAILKEIVVERAIVAREMVVRNASRSEAVKSLLGTVALEEISREEFKVRVAGVRAVVRTGECTPYANILLQSSVAFGTPTPAP